MLPDKPIKSIPAMPIGYGLDRFWKGHTVEIPWDRLNTEQDWRRRNIPSIPAKKWKDVTNFHLFEKDMSW